MITRTESTLSLNPNNSAITMYYDDACLLCSTEASNMQARNPKDIKLISVDAGLDKLTAAGFSRVDAMTYLCIQDSRGDWHTHMDAVRLLYKTAGIRWAKWLYLPVIKQLGDFAYPYVAHNRYRIPDCIIKLIYGKAAVQSCQNGVCKIAPDER